MSKKYSGEEIYEFAAALPTDDKDKLVAGCVKKLFRCQLQTWYECVAHARYWDDTLDGCTRPFQDTMEQRDTAAEMRRP